LAKNSVIIIIIIVIIIIIILSSRRHQVMLFSCSDAVAYCQMSLQPDNVFQDVVSFLKAGRMRPKPQMVFTG